MQRFFLFLLAAATLSAQSPAARKAAPKAAPAAHAASGVIGEIHVEGNEFYNEAQVLQVAGLKRGEPATNEAFERARDRVLASGCFESFGWKYEPLADGSSLKVTLEVTEPSQFYGWTLDRLQIARPEALARVRRELPLFGERIPTSDRFLQRVAGILQAALEEKGAREQVNWRVLLLGKDQMTVVFGPQTPPPNVAEVRINGARVLDSHYLVKQLAAVAVGTPYIESNFRLFLEWQLKTLYEAVGHLQVAFPRVTSAPAATGRGVVVTVEVAEGPLYKLSAVQVRGTPLGEDEIQELGQFKLEQPVSYSLMAGGMKRILDRLKQDGYLSASYKAGRELDQEKRTAAVTVDVEVGPQYLFRALTVKGLDLESEPVIRKMWALEPGQPYREGYADVFLGQVKERGIFDNLGQTKADVRIDDRALRVDVTLTFRGDPETEKRRRERERRRPN